MVGAARLVFEKRLAELNEEILFMGAMARRELSDAVLSLDQGYVDLAREVIARDLEINARRLAIERTCYALIATEQPVAGDLRAIIAALSISADLERTGDHAKKTAKVALRMADTPRPLFTASIPHMAKLTQAMLQDALTAFALRDLNSAGVICAADDQVDALYKQSFNLLLSYMIENPRAISAGTYLIQIAHELERVGDRATNIAERVIYAVTGELADLNV